MVLCDYEEVGPVMFGRCYVVDLVRCQVTSHRLIMSSLSELSIGMRNAISHSLFTRFFLLAAVQFLLSTRVNVFTLAYSRARVAIEFSSVKLRAVS
jgi:hypothetical protein